MSNEPTLRKLLIWASSMVISQASKRSISGWNKNMVSLSEQRPIWRRIWRCRQMICKSSSLNMRTKYKSGRKRNLICLAECKKLQTTRKKWDTIPVNRLKTISINTMSIKGNLRKQIWVFKHLLLEWQSTSLLWQQKERLEELTQPEAHFELVACQDTIR